MIVYVCVCMWRSLCFIFSFPMDNELPICQFCWFLILAIWDSVTLIVNAFSYMYVGELSWHWSIWLKCTIHKEDRRMLGCVLFCVCGAFVFCYMSPSLFCGGDIGPRVLVWIVVPWAILKCKPNLSIFILFIFYYIILFSRRNILGHTCITYLCKNSTSLRIMELKAK